MLEEPPDDADLSERVRGALNLLASARLGVEGARLRVLKAPLASLSSAALERGWLARARRLAEQGLDWRPDDAELRAALAAARAAPDEPPWSTGWPSPVGACVAIGSLAAIFSMVDPESLMIGLVLLCLVSFPLAAAGLVGAGMVVRQAELSRWLWACASLLAVPYFCLFPLIALTSQGPGTPIYPLLVGVASYALGSLGSQLLCLVRLAAIFGSPRADSLACSAAFGLAVATLPGLGIGLLATTIAMGLANP